MYKHISADSVQEPGSESVIVVCPYFDQFTTGACVVPLTGTGST